MVEFTLRQEIELFLEEMEKKHSLFKYICNAKAGDFDYEKDTVYYSGPYWDKEEKIATLEAILAGKWLSAGEHVYQFEKEFSKFFNCAHSVMVNSGSSANLLLISALKKYFSWQDGDEIIISPVGFPTTLTPLIQNWLTPVFIDISLKDLNFDVDKIEEKITAKTRAIFISPVLGNPPDMDKLIVLAETHHIKLILDNCDSLGSKWRGRYLNEYCVASSCSFYPAHHITTGQGGMVSSEDHDLIRLARSLSSWGGDCTCVGSSNLLAKGSCGRRFSKWIPEYDGIIDHRYLFTNIGYNLKPLDLQGAMGSAQLKKFNEIHRLRRKNKHDLQGYLVNNITGVRVLCEHEQAETSWFGVGIICDHRELKEKLVFHLEKNRVQTRNYFAGNLLMHPAFRNYGNMEEYPNANQVMQRMFFIGCSPTITAEMVKYIGSIIKKADQLK